MSRKKREMRTLAKAAILVRILKAVSGRARVYLRDPKKMQGLVTDADERAQLVGEAGTMARQTLTYLGTMARLGKAFVRREYRAVPWGALVGATAAVLYFVMPLDFIPDILAGMGLVDDAALIAFVAMQIRGDLEKFTFWERSRLGGAISPETAAIDGAARTVEASRLVTPSGVMEDVYLEPGTEPIPLPLPDETIERAADAVLEAVEEAEAEQAYLDEVDLEARKAARAAEKAAKDAEKAARREAKARKRASKSE